MHAHFVRSADAAFAFLRDTLVVALRAGELSGVKDVERFARVVEATITGSLFTWANAPGMRCPGVDTTESDLLLAPCVKAWT